MALSNASSAPPYADWFRTSRLLAGGLGAILLATAWASLFLKEPRSMALSFAGTATFLLGSAYALNARPRAKGLLGFGKRYVQVRSLTEWTLYQYGLPFEDASPDQQSEALAHYRVGLRLFPSRPQDMAHRQGAWQRLLALLAFCAFITFCELAHGWARALIVLAIYSWLLACMHLSKRFTDTPATSTLTELPLRNGDSPRPAS